jgi:Uma2 family endonuclease
MDPETAMSMPRLHQTGYTPGDWRSWEGRWELIDGAAYDMTPSPSTEHQRVNLRLLRSVAGALDRWKRKPGGRSCECFPPPFDVHLESGVFQPDLVVVCDPAKVTPRGLEGTPDLVVEILSPATASKDLTIKRWAYERARIPEYLIVDPGERYGILLRLAGDRYEEFRIAWGTVARLMGGQLPVTLG